jgi:DNA-directed RNA polymerase subunit L
MLDLLRTRSYYLLVVVIVVNILFVNWNSDDVTFVGHTIPHPSENEMHIRIQTDGVSAVDILRRAFTDLIDILEHTEDFFVQTIEQHKKDHDPDPTEAELYPYPPPFGLGPYM